MSGVISRKVRERLLALGVPKHKHELGTLASLVPAAAGLDVAALAASVIHLAEKGLLSLAAMRAESMEGHDCLFYRDRAELLDLLVPYLRAGIERGERLVWILADGLPEREARRALGAATPAYEAFVRSGGLEIYARDEWYDRPLDKVLEHWLAKERQALAEGFSGLRLTGDGSWVQGPDLLKEGLEYERRAGAVFAGRAITALCTYRTTDVSAARSKQLKSCHQLALEKQGGAWVSV
jgi:hypothetical protein